ncbi:hypothetical protein GGX14DRAFT_526491 [Mycena pura]|uniref:Uncharacterized protein n=1 Tax=Mycena pura TaxID=153505 RepID=A0AAD6V112_9AGAR|nr:hypothetical protein GGX14DRAFT_526491 [Mycena pura]
MLIWILCKKFIARKGVVLATLLLVSPIIGLLWQARPRHTLGRLLDLLWPARSYTTYRTTQEVDRYWAAAEVYGRRLRSSDARFGGRRPEKASHIPAVTSYTPALLPYYRQRKRKKTTEYRLSLRAICKWHRMVFRGPWHPSIPQASRMRERFSAEDRGEIHRISRMIPDEMVFGREARKWKPKYRDIWRKWLARDHREFSVFFELE